MERGPEAAAEMATDFSGRVGVVTGASGGIGGAVVRAFARGSARIHAVGRDGGRLAELASSDASGDIVPEELDLTDPGSIASFAERLSSEGGVDFLVHCAGAIEHGTFASSTLRTLEEMIEVNVVAVHELTRALLPALVAASGDVVIVNSSVTRFPRAYSGQFAVTQHALVGFADALRAEVNESGVRVLSVFPGRTATARTERLSALRDVPYRPDRLLQPESVAEVIVSALRLPRTAEVTELHIRPALPR